MADVLSLAAPVLLLAVIFFILLAVFYKAVKTFRFNSFMKSLAYDLALHYIHSVPTRPPTVSGIYEGREVSVDVISDGSQKNHEFTRVRVFHTGAIENEFTMGDSCYFEGSVGARNIDSGNPELDRRFKIRCTDIAKTRKYLDEQIQEKMLAAGIPFTVGKHEVVSLLPGKSTDKDRVVKTLNFLIFAAYKADKISL